jgi:hypothetical protein
MTWRGEFIEVVAGAHGRLVWSWHACCRCGHELVNGESIERGFGPDCWADMTEAEVERLRINARISDRKLYERDRAFERFQNFKRAPNPPRTPKLPGF